MIFKSFYLMPEKINFISDIRMLELIDILKQSEVIRFTQEFCDAIGFKKQNIRNVKIGLQHFTPEHIRKACLVYNRDANWIFDLKYTKIAVTKNVTKIAKK